MEINFTYRLEDYTAMVAARKRHKPLKFWINTVFYWGMVIINLVAGCDRLYRMLMQGETLQLVDFANLLIAFALLFGRYVIMPWLISSAVSKQNMIATPFAYTLDENGIGINAPEINHLVQWQSVKRVDQTKTHIFFWVNTVNAVTLPFRAIRDQHQYSKLQHLLSQHLKIANSQT